MRDFLKRYWVEVIFGIFFILGIFFLIEDINIWAFMSDIFKGLLFSISTFSTSISQAATRYISLLEISDLVGFVMVVGAGVILLVRARRRFVQSNRYGGRLCPRCGSAILRMHRMRRDQFLGRILFLEFHRYRCGNQECEWRGLRKPGRTRSYT